MRRGNRLMAIGLLAPLIPFARNLREIEKKVSEFTLANGMHFIVVERHEAPAASFHTYVNAGSVDDPPGAAGIAHMFERLMFQGTPRIGALNWLEEKKALDAIEVEYDRLEAEKRKGTRVGAGELSMRRCHHANEVHSATAQLRKGSRRGLCRDADSRAVTQAASAAHLAALRNLPCGEMAQDYRSSASVLLRRAVMSTAEMSAKPR